jgi:hypothetical protein
MARSKKLIAKATGSPNVGDPVAFRFEKADMADMLTGAARVLNDLVTRQMIDVVEGKVQSPDLRPDASLLVLGELVQAFDSGHGLGQVKSQVDRLTMAQDDRMVLVDSLVTQHSLVRMARLMAARDRLERFMLSATERSDLTPSEALLFLKMIQTDMSEIKESIKPTPIKDARGLVDKVDYAQKRTLAGAMAKYDRTSPQGREIIRKVLHGLLKRANGANDKKGKPSSASGPRDSSEGLE